MLRQIVLCLCIFVCIVSSEAVAQEIGSATGAGSIERLLPTGNSEQVSFAPRYSHAYTEETGGNRFTWIVLTEKEPPLSQWMAAKDPAEARQIWCGQEKASFVAVKLDAKWNVDLYFLCPANSAVSTEMLSTWNGLDSVQVTFDVREGKRLKGTLRTGVGSCPGPDGAPAYCTQTGDYTFDALLAK
jgi:hypothetical protein